MTYFKCFSAIALLGVMSIAPLPASIDFFVPEAHAASAASIKAKAQKKARKQKIKTLNTAIKDGDKAVGEANLNLAKAQNAFNERVKVNETNNIQNAEKGGNALTPTIRRDIKEVSVSDTRNDPQGAALDLAQRQLAEASRITFNLRTQKHALVSQQNAGKISRFKRIKNTLLRRKNDRIILQEPPQVAQNPAAQARARARANGYDSPPAELLDRPVLVRRKFQAIQPGDVNAAVSLGRYGAVRPALARNASTNLSPLRADRPASTTLSPLRADRPASTTLSPLRADRPASTNLSPLRPDNPNGN